MSFAVEDKQEENFQMWYIDRTTGEAVLVRPTHVAVENKGDARKCIAAEANKTTVDKQR